MGTFVSQARRLILVFVPAAAPSCRIVRARLYASCTMYGKLKIQKPLISISVDFSMSHTFLLSLHALVCELVYNTLSTNK